MTKVVQYTHLDYESYRKLEEQCRAFKETTHLSTGGFYHKSIRLQITPDLIIEYHGPLVGGYGHHVGRKNSRKRARRNGSNAAHPRRAKKAKS